MDTKIPQEWNKSYLKDVSFVNIMTRRIFNILIVANPYDAFMLEDEGRVDEKIFDEYMDLQRTCDRSFHVIQPYGMRSAGYSTAFKGGNQRSLAEGKSKGQ